MSAPEQQRPGVVGAVALVCVLGGAVLAALLETLLVPLYVGTVIVPVAVVMAAVGNLVFPLLARWAVPRTWAAALPVLAWLVVVFGFGAGSRPEGDVILPGSPTQAEYVTYALLLVGALTGAGALVLSVPRRTAPPVRRRDSHQGRAGS